MTADKDGVVWVCNSRSLRKRSVNIGPRIKHLFCLILLALCFISCHTVRIFGHSHQYIYKHRSLHAIQDGIYLCLTIGNFVVLIKNNHFNRMQIACQLTHRSGVITFSYRCISMVTSLKNHHNLMLFTHCAFGFSFLLHFITRWSLSHTRVNKEWGGSSRWVMRAIAEWWDCSLINNNSVCAGGAGGGFYSS